VLTILLLVLVWAAGAARADAPLVYCTGTESGGEGPRRYAYEVDSASFPMIEFRVGTNDLRAEHYADVLTPRGWSFVVEKTPMGHIDGVKTPHGRISPGPCRCLTQGSVRWWTDDPGSSVEYFTFGFDHAWSSEDVSWLLRTRREEPRPEFYDFRESWDAAVGTGMGPLHGPSMARRPGDIDCDGDVDDDDLSVLLANWNMDVGCEKGNLNGDQSVNDDDLSLLLAHWTGSGSPDHGTIPEPVTFGVLAFGTVSLLQRHRRR